MQRAEASFHVALFALALAMIAYITAFGAHLACSACSPLMPRASSCTCPRPSAGTNPCRVIATGCWFSL